jgi:hypothetical protein
MLRLAGDQVESLLDELLPVEVRELPAELAVLDRLLADPRLLAPIEQAWERAARGHGRPTIPMASFVRLMVIKQRTGWGYETLVGEVSDSLHLRRCRWSCIATPSAPWISTAAHPGTETIARWRRYRPMPGWWPACSRRR